MPNRIWHHSVSCLHYFRVIAMRNFFVKCKWQRMVAHGFGLVCCTVGRVIVTIVGCFAAHWHQMLFAEHFVFLHSSANLGHATPSSRSPLMLPSNASGLAQAKSISCCRGPSKGARASDALLSGGKAVFSIGNQTAIPYQVIGLSPSSSSSSCCPSSSSSSSSSSAAAAPFLFPSACAFLPRC